MGNCLVREREKDLSTCSIVWGKLNCCGAVDHEEKVDPSPLLQPGMRAPLLRILNHTRPSSFVALLKTSQEMREFSLQQRGVEVPFKDVTIHVEEKEGQAVARASAPGILLEEEHLEDISRLPFALHVTELGFWKEVDDNAMAAAWYFLISYYVKRIDKIYISQKVTAWDDFLFLVKANSVKHLKFGAFSIIPETILEDISKFDLDFFGFWWKAVSPSFLATTSIPELELFGTIPARPSLATIVQRWLDGFPLKSWQFSRRVENVEMCAVFLNFETLSFDYEGELPSTRPLVFAKPSTEGRQVRTEFWVLREDGAFLFCGHDHNFELGEYFSMTVVKEKGHKRKEEGKSS